MSRANESTETVERDLESETIALSSALSAGH